MTARPAPTAQTTDVSGLLPGELGYAKEFVQFLNDSGLSIKAVSSSKFNSFFSETDRAVFIRTDKGVLEVVFFDSDSDVERIQVSDQPSEASQPRDHIVHEYVIRTPATKQKIVGPENYFTKYHNKFIITIDRELNDELKRLLT